MSQKTRVNPVREWMVPIVVASIGVVGTFAPALVSSISSQSSEKPAVDIQFEDASNQAVELSLTNTGFAAATNITLIVDASGKIDESSNYILHTVQVEPVKIADKRLEAHVPKLVQGSGSIVKLNIESLNSSYYSAYVTYDQGSSMKEYPQSFSTSFNILWDSFGAYYTIFVLLFTAMIIGITLVRWKKKQRRIVISKIIENITQIRRILKDNNKSTSVLWNTWKAETRTENESPEDDLDEQLDNAAAFIKPFRKKEPPHLVKKNVQGYIRSKHVQDYIVLDDFYTKLDERNQSLSDNISQDKLKKVNKNLIRLANNALRNIDWDKYII